MKITSIILSQNYNGAIVDKTINGRNRRFDANNVSPLDYHNYIEDFPECFVVSNDEAEPKPKKKK